MTQLEFTQKNFKEGTKFVLIEDKISTFSLGEVSMDFTKEDWCLFAYISWNKTPQKKENFVIGVKHIREENSGFNFYLVTEEY